MPPPSVSTTKRKPTRIREQQAFALIVYFDRRRNVDRFSLDDRHDLLHLEAQSLDHILNDRRSDPDCGQRVLSFASVPALGIVSQGQLRSGWQALGVTRDEACAACAAKRGAVETYPFGADTAVYKVGGKMFALIPRSAEPPRLSLKCDPEWAEVLRNAYAAVQPGYHLNKKHWNTIVLDRSIPDDELEELIEHSYALIVESLPQRVRSAL